MKSLVERLVWIRLPNGKIKGSFPIDRVRMALRNGKVPTGCEIGVSSTGPWLPLNATNKPVQSPDQMPPPQTRWYFAKAGKKNGPVSETRLVELAQSGIIMSTDLVWARGMTNWVVAGEADCLASVFGVQEADSPPIPIDPASMARQTTVAAQPTQSKWNWNIVLGVCIVIGVLLKLIAGQVKTESTPSRITTEQIEQPPIEQPPNIFMEDFKRRLEFQRKAPGRKINEHNVFRGSEVE